MSGSTLPSKRTRARVPSDRYLTAREHRGMERWAREALETMYLGRVSGRSKPFNPPRIVQKATRGVVP